MKRGIYNNYHFYSVFFFNYKKIRQIYQKRKKPIILTGDLNSEPDNSVIRFLRGEVSIDEQTVNLQDTFKALRGEPGGTFRHFTGKTKGEPIDYIFCTPEIHMKTTEIDTNKVRGGYPSDHYPVIALVEY